MKNIMILLATLSLVSCANLRKSGDQGEDRFKKPYIEKNVIKGNTKKVDIIKKFGHPELVETDSEKREVWVYSKHSRKSGGSGIGVGVSSGIASSLLAVFTPVDISADMSESESQDTTVTLSIYFSKDDVVDYYEYSKNSINI